MQGEKKERWMNLCEQAAQEQYPEKLILLEQEITRFWTKSRKTKEHEEQIGQPGRQWAKAVS